ncbi:hypothetical protein FALBO_12322 [Fusarium albosuccineum]|uniref:Clr5 domain-containing protein n=1 Tax=Fusarium albosuccineum TaxID=1237068 RepID=A0A8H4L2L7_9HYPO|nr:hypothetical protein FALBO_12322 [Fusarium albosuccineum]
MLYFYNMEYNNMPCYRTLAPRVRSPGTLEPLTQPEGVFPKQRRHHHSAEAWETQKPVIVQLYACENRTAKEVVDILQRGFRFEVCLRKLRTKLQEWGMYKTLNHSEGNLRTRRVRGHKKGRYSSPNLLTGGDVTHKAKQQNAGIPKSLVSPVVTQPPDARHVIADSNGDTSPLPQILSQAPDGNSRNTSTKTSENHMKATSESLDDHHEESPVEDSPTLPLKTYCLREIPEGHDLRHHHILKDCSTSQEGLACCSDGLPQDPQSSTTVFQVSVRYSWLDVTIFSEDLYYGLRSLFPSRLWEEGRRFNGQLLLMNYTRLKAQLERLRKLEHFPNITPSLLEEWELLVDGFVGNRLAFQLFNFKDPSIYSVLDNRLRAVFAQQELDHGIESLNQAFFDVNQLFPEGDDQTEGHNMRVELETALRTASPEQSEREPPTASRLESTDPCPRDGGVSESLPNSTAEHTDLHTQTIDASWDTPGRRIRAVDVAQDPEIREQERLKLQKFRERFIRHYLLLKQATKDSSTELYRLSAGLRSYKDAWAVAMRTMRQLVRLKVPSLLGALCFLCATRAMADSVSDNEDAYKDEFIQDLVVWWKILPGIEEAALLIWNVNKIDFDLKLQRLRVEHCWLTIRRRLYEYETRRLYQTTGRETFTPPTRFPYYYSEPNAMQQLRESVAGLISTAHKTFGLETEPGLNGWQQIDKGQSLAHTKSSTPQATRWDIEPPDMLIAPNALFLKNKFQGTRCFNIVLLVTSIMFALVVLFILGLFKATLVASRTWKLIQS